MIRVWRSVWSVAAVSGIVGLAACATQHIDPPEVMGPIADAGTRQGVSAEQLERGRDLYANNCQKCHNLVLPEKRTPEQWDKILPRMTKRAKLDEGQKADVRAYILAAREARAQ